MPSSKNYVRDHKQERKTAIARGDVSPGKPSPNQKRKKLRRLALKMGMVKKGDGKDVDHKKPLSKGGSNSIKNARAVPASKNRSFKRRSDGSMK